MTARDSVRNAADAEAHLRSRYVRRCTCLMASRHGRTASQVCVHACLCGVTDGSARSSCPVSHGGSLPSCSHLLLRYRCRCRLALRESQSNATATINVYSRRVHSYSALSQRWICCRDMIMHTLPVQRLGARLVGMRGHLRRARSARHQHDPAACRQTDVGKPLCGAQHLWRRRHEQHHDECMTCCYCKHLACVCMVKT